MGIHRAVAVVVEQAPGAIAPGRSTSMFADVALVATACLVAAGAFAQCVVTCPGGGIQQIDGCGGIDPDPNGGCGAGSELYQAIGVVALGAPKVVCGTVGALGTGSRDIDCYRFTLEHPSLIRVTASHLDGGGSPAPNFMVSIVNGTGCATQVTEYVGVSGACPFVSDQVALPPGDHVAILTVDALGPDQPACPVAYVAGIEVTQLLPGSCGAGGGCFEEHAASGCGDLDCCGDVCAIFSHCCVSSWDEACVEVALATCAMPAAFGMSHLPLGAATLSPQPDGSLAVVGIGPSGQDGVSVKPGSLDGDFVLGFDAGEPPIGASVTFSVIGQVGGVPDQPISTLTAEVVTTPQGSAVILSPDFSAIGATTYGVYLQLGDGACMLAGTGLKGGAIELPSLPRCELKSGRRRVDRCWPAPKHKWLGRFFDAMFISVAGGGGAMADVVEIAPDDALLTVDFISDVRITASNMPGFAIDDEALVPIGGFAYRALGDAHIAAEVGAVGFVGLESCGESGMRIDVGRAGPVGIELADMPTPSELPAGAEIVVSYTGSVGGVPESPLGLLHMSVIADMLVIQPDFTDAGASTYVAQVFDDGVLVGTLVDQKAAIHVVGNSATWPRWIRKIFEFQTKCVNPTWDEDQAFLLAGGAIPAWGDELRLLVPVDASGVDHVSDITLTACGMPQIVIIGEAFEPAVAFQPADLDGNGVVDGGDLGLMLGQWGSPGSGDLDGDGTVDGADLGLLLGAWGIGA